VHLNGARLLRLPIFMTAKQGGLLPASGNYRRALPSTLELVACGLEQIAKDDRSSRLSGSLKRRINIDFVNLRCVEEALGEAQVDTRAQEQLE